MTHPKTISVTNKEIEVVLTKTDITKPRYPVPQPKSPMPAARSSKPSRTKRNRHTETLPAGNTPSAYWPSYILNPDVFRFTSMTGQGKRHNVLHGRTDRTTDLQVRQRVRQAHRRREFSADVPGQDTVKFRLENGIYIASKDGDIEQLVTDKNGQIVVRYRRLAAFTSKRRLPPKASSLTRRSTRSSSKEATASAILCRSA